MCCAAIADVFNKNASFIRVYTNPITTVANDQEDFFGMIIYHSKEKTFKEGNMMKSNKINKSPSSVFSYG
jgi:hypothetical protein